MRLCYAGGTRCARCRHRVAPWLLVQPKPLRRAFVCLPCWHRRPLEVTRG